MSTQEFGITPDIFRRPGFSITASVTEDIGQPPEINVIHNMPPGKRRPTRDYYGAHVAAVTLTLPEGIFEVSAKDLLPRHLRAYYGFAPEHLIEDSNYMMCFQAATWWNDPSLIYERYNGLEVLYADYRRLKLGEPQIYGDVMLLTYKSVTGNTEYHACSFIGPDLVFSKNGRGPTVPFLLRKTEDVIKNYAPTPDKIVRLEWYTPRTSK